jgi:hypothetical protein
LLGVFVRFFKSRFIGSERDVVKTTTIACKGVRDPTHHDTERPTRDEQPEQNAHREDAMAPITTKA